MVGSRGGVTLVGQAFVAAPLVLMALAAALSRRPRTGGAVSVCVPCFGRVARALGLILVTITLSLAWPSLAQHSRASASAEGSFASRSGLVLWPRDRVWFLLVSYRPLAPRSHNFGQSWPLPDERDG